MTESEVTQVVLSQLPEGARVQTAERHEADDRCAFPYWKVGLIHGPVDASGAMAVLLAIVNDETGEMTNCFWSIG